MGPNKNEKENDETKKNHCGKKHITIVLPHVTKGEKNERKTFVYSLADLHAGFVGLLLTVLLWPGKRVHVKFTGRETC